MTMKRVGNLVQKHGTRPDPQNEGQTKNNYLGFGMLLDDAENGKRAYKLDLRGNSVINKDGFPKVYYNVFKHEEKGIPAEEGTRSLSNVLYQTTGKDKDGKAVWNKIGAEFTDNVSGRINISLDFEPIMVPQPDGTMAAWIRAFPPKKREDDGANVIAQAATNVDNTTVMNDEIPF